MLNQVLREVKTATGGVFAAACLSPLEVFVLSWWGVHWPFAAPGNNHPLIGHMTGGISLIAISATGITNWTHDSEITLTVTARNYLDCSISGECH